MGSLFFVAVWTTIIVLTLSWLTQNILTQKAHLELVYLRSTGRGALVMKFACQTVGKGSIPVVLLFLFVFCFAPSVHITLALPQAAQLSLQSIWWKDEKLKDERCTSTRDLLKDAPLIARQEREE